MNMASSANAIKSIGSLLRNRFLTFPQALSEIYRPSINKQKNKLLEVIKEKAEIASQSKYAQKMRVLKGYYTLEMSPPSSSADMDQLKKDIGLIKDFVQKHCYKHLTVQQAWLLFLVGLEISLWFYLGETIGKMHIVGYQV